MASYSLATLWYERQRYLPGVLAVAFSALLIALQCGLLLGLFSITSIPIDHTLRMCGWARPRCCRSIWAGPSPRARWRAWACSRKSNAARPYLQGFAFWAKPERRQRIVHGHRLAAQPGFAGQNRQN